jgi:hypothetical protein
VGEAGRGERQAPLFHEEQVKAPVDEEQKGGRPRREEEPDARQEARGQAERNQPDQ